MPLSDEFDEYDAQEAFVYGKFNSLQSIAELR